MYDAIIVGGGPAGLSAALPLGRMLRSTLVLDSGEPRNAPAEHMHNFLSRDGTTPSELRLVSRQQLEQYATVEVRDVPVVSARQLPEGDFEVTLAGNESVRGRRLLLATGVVDELPPIDGMAELWGRGVFHCPYCHGYEVRGVQLAVLGGTPAAAHLALHLRRLSDDVVLCTNGPAQFDPALADALARQSVEVYRQPVVRLDVRDGNLERIAFADGTSLARGAMFCTTATMRQRSELPRQLGLKVLPDALVEVDTMGRTNVPGIFAAGDMARRSNFGQLSAVIAAAASGAFAGAVIDKELVAEDVGMAAMVPAVK